MTNGPSERPGPPGGKRDLNRRRRIDDLVQAGTRLFLDRGIDNVTIDDIAREAGTAKGNFYRYFADKTALVTSILAPLQSDIQAAMATCETQLHAANDRDALFAAYQVMGMAMAGSFLRDRDVVLFFLEEHRGPAIGSRAPVRDLSDEVIEAAIRLTRVACDHGLLRVDDPRVSALAVVGAVDRIALSMLRGKLDGDPLAITQILIGLVLDGIRVHD